MFVIDDLHGSWHLPQLFVAEEFMAHRSLSICVPKRHPCGRWNVHLEPTYFGKHHPLNWSSVWRDHASKVTLSTCFCGYRYQNRLTSTSQTDVFNNMNVLFLALLDTPMTQFIPIHQVISQCCPLTFIPQIPIAIPTSSAETWSPGAHQCAEAAAAAHGCLPGAHREVPGRCGPGLTVKVGKMIKCWGNTISGWWSFGTCFHFPYLGNVIIPTDFRIFQRGCFTTHQI